MIVVPFIYFLYLFCYQYKRSGYLDVSCYLIIPYVITSFFAILIAYYKIYDFYDGIWSNADISFFAIATYCVLISLSIMPFSRIQCYRIERIVCPNYKYVDLLSCILIITFFSTVYTTYNNLEEILQTSLDEVRSEVYKDVDANKVTGVDWLIQLPYTLFKQYSPLALLFFFNNVLNERRSKLFNYLLFTSSLTPVLAAVLIAGRTQIVYWLLNFGLMYVIFCRSLNSKQKRFILKPLLIFGSLLLIFFVMVTVSRFYTSKFGSGNDSVILYLGQQVLQFNYFFTHYECHQITLNRIFPLTHYFFIDPSWNLTDYRDLIASQNRGANIGVFYTFLGDLLVDIGFVGMFLYVIVYSLISKSVCRIRTYGNVELRQLILVLVLVLVPLEGVFYYSYYRVDVSYFVIGSLLLYWSLSPKK